ncbi:MAG: hypothetical protein IPN79_06685 [Saprospiraceae bacterium]|nr:hypothetical protein [Saprospiraceae bacterium]
MGLQFQYSGRLKEAGLLQDLMNEIEDICDTLRWPVDVNESKFEEELFSESVGKDNYGISFTPTDCDPVFFVFNSQGRLWNPFMKDILSDDHPKEIKVFTVQLNLNDDDPEPVIMEGNKEVDLDILVYKITVKTKTNNPSSYIQLIELIRYISEKYFIDFELIDDSGFWKTKNVDVLTKRMISAKLILDELHQKMSEMSFKDPEDFLDFIKQLSKTLKQSLKDEEE